MNNNESKKQLDELMKEIPSSFIDIKPTPQIDNTSKIDINTIIAQLWNNKSSKLEADYKYGHSLALYGNQELTTIKIFSRLAHAINSIVTNELQKSGHTSETMKSYYNILENVMILIAKEIDKKDLRDYEPSSIISALQGYIINYGKKENK